MIVQQQFFFLQRVFQNKNKTELICCLHPIFKSERFHYVSTKKLVIYLGTVIQNEILIYAYVILYLRKI